MSNAESVVAMMNQISPKHKWDDEQRSTLAVLEKFYAVPKSVQAKVFNKIYWQTLYHEGFTNGLTPEALVSQIADLKHSPRGEIFRYLLTCGPQHAYCRRLKDKIEAVAGILNIALQPRRPTSGSFSGLQVLTASASYNHIESPPTKRGRLVRDSESCSSSTESLAEPSGCDFDSDSDSDTECSETIWVANSSDSSLDEFEEDSLESETHRVNPRLRIKRDHHNRKIHSRPRLLFRAFRPSHNLKARRFLGTPSTSIPSPPAYGSREFEEEVLRHLSADSTFNSPWLSFTASLDRALKIITSAKHVLHLAVVDYNVLEEGLKDRVGDHDKIWLVPVLCKEAKDDRLRNLRKVDDEISTRSLPAYNGRDEFLVWGSIPCESVGLLSKATVCKLVGAVPKITDLSYDTGLFLANYLQDIEERYKAIVAYKIIRAFKVNGYHRGSRHWTFEDFRPWALSRENRQKSLSFNSTKSKPSCR